MTSFVVSLHAAERWCERVNPSLTPVQAIGVIEQHARIIEAAIQFGCTYVKINRKTRLVLQGAVVVTVYGFEQRPRSTRWDVPE
ncbi:hypothetical protein M9978_16635 [Sphingomonas sp. MG17]|uniref:Uncharacterized protein n=1 Tax=Sphingomonas tagetis TaxID=2949092 RepID=A0A9X2HJL5_9SPHN|nr:hypothetical protein [Sphingomonas tagetis]MCP3732053.1 hypothetical protein [Sphingomonas tagetis]